MIEIFDGHNDSVQRFKEYSHDGVDFLERSATGHLDLQRAQEGGMFGGLFAMFVRAEQPPKNNGTVTGTSNEVRLPEAINPVHAKREIAKQLAAFKALEARACGKIRIATSVDEIEKARLDHAFAIVIHMEGAESIGPDLHELEELYDAGLRSLGIVWSRPNIFGHGVTFAWPRSPDTGPGLTSLGKDLVRECNRRGIMIDLSHLNEQGFWDVEKLTTAPLVATHSCVHTICPSTRNLTDMQLDAIRESDGIVGVNFCVNDVRPDGLREADTPLDMLAKHFVYLANRIGIERVAIGSDFDGTRIPAAIADASGLPKLIAALRGYGFDDSSLRKIGYENWMRVLRLSLR
ncbi:dipeptidase [Acidicapsa ligni]|uniref:dipeptidase n=1 Tax=Acidicapsa ligni TaxID=542300 RepID=UPI0021E0AEB4|nr:dipeptidase [Acidicapsa ligni]